jgi:hypothetical protein
MVDNSWPDWLVSRDWSDNNNSWAKSLLDHRVLLEETMDDPKIKEAREVMNGECTTRLVRLYMTGRHLPKLLFAFSSITWNSHAVKHESW